MGDRHIYIDSSAGETRGVITLGGKPERLFVEREGDVYPRLGERFRARVALVDRALGLALLDLGQGRQASLRLKADRPPPHQGQALDVEIAIELQGGKPAVARVLPDGAASVSVEPVSLRERLSALAPGAAFTEGGQARDVADLAEEEALAVEHPLPGGGSLAVEPTRALVAVDVDLGAGGARDPKRAARQANLTALAELGRLLRLKALGGLVVIDLVGRGHDGQALSRAAQAAFQPDQPGVVIGPVTRFGTLELALPRRSRPIRDILCRPDGGLRDETLALRLVRAVAREAAAQPGVRLKAICAPAIAAAAAGPASQLAGIVGGRFELVADPACPRDRWDIISQ